MSKVRINDLAREMEVKSRQILDVLGELGLGEGKTHSSSIEDHEADKVRAQFERGSKATGHASGTSSRGSQSIAPKIDLSHVSKPGDVMKAILAKKQEQEAEARRGAAPPRPAPPAAPKAPVKPTTPVVTVAAPPAASCTPGAAQDRSSSPACACHHSLLLHRQSPRDPFRTCSRQSTGVGCFRASSGDRCAAVGSRRGKTACTHCANHDSTARSGARTGTSKAGGAKTDRSPLSLHPPRLKSSRSLRPHRCESPAPIAEVPAVQPLSPPRSTRFPALRRPSRTHPSTQADQAPVSPAPPAPPPIRRVVMPQTGPRPVYKAPIVAPSATAPAAPAAGIQRGKPIFDRRPSGPPSGGPGGYQQRTPRAFKPGQFPGGPRPKHPTRTTPRRLRGTRRSWRSPGLWRTAWIRCDHALAAVLAAHVRCWRPLRPWRSSAPATCRSQRTRRTPAVSPRRRKAR